MFDTLSELAVEWILPTVFFWFVLCILATNVQEWVATLMAAREHHLTNAVNKMLGDPELIQKFYRSPLIYTNTYTSKSVEPAWLKKIAVFRKKEQRPDYIDPQLFAKVILSWVVEEHNAEMTKQKFATPIQIHENLRRMRATHTHLAEILEILLSEFREKNMSYHEVFIGLQTSIENWFNAVMEETTRAYRRTVQLTLLHIGLLISILVNFDPIFLTTQLWDFAPSQETASTLPVGWNPRSFINRQDESCRLIPSPKQEFGIPLSLYNTCISPASPTSNTNIFYKFAGFIIGAILIRIGSIYVHDLWKSRIGQ